MAFPGGYRIFGRPVSLRLTGGQVHDACEAEALVEAVPDGATLLGDKGAQRYQKWSAGLAIERVRAISHQT